MGCSSSAQVSAAQSAQDPVPDNYYLREIQYLKDSLQLSNVDINSLFQDFRKMDLNKQHRITYTNYTTYLKIKPLPLIATIFHYFSSDMQTLIFPEFVLLVNFFLSLDEIGLAQFLHLLLFDATFSEAYFSSKNLTCESTERRVQILLGNTWGSVDKIKKIVAKMGGIDHRTNSINHQRFVNYCIKNRSLLNLIVTHHLNLKRKIHSKCNKNNWEERNPESGSIWDGRYGIGNHLMNEINRLRTMLHKIESDPTYIVTDVVPVALPVLEVEGEL